MTLPIVLIVILALLALLAFSSVRIAREYERGVVFRLGRLIDLKGPGLFLIFPLGIDRLTKVDLRVITLEVPPQEVITSVNAVIFFQVLDPRAADHARLQLRSGHLADRPDHAARRARAVE